jgi:dihydrofolate reductase
MRKVIVGAFVSMDGVMQAPGGPDEDPTGGFKYGGWVAPMADTDPVFGEEIGKLFGQPYDLLLGHKTYEIFAAHWPYAEGGPDDEIAKQFNRITKYVATRSREVDTSWEKTVVRQGCREAEATGRPGAGHAGQHGDRARAARRWLGR